MTITKRLKNNSGADKLILTRIVPHGTYYDVNYRYWVQVLDDEDVMADVDAGVVVVNDGVSDLSVVAGQAWLKRFQEDQVVKHKRIIVLGKNGSASNIWLRPHDGINSDKSYWLAERDYRVLGVKFSNTKNGSASNPIVTRITCYGQPVGSSGNITTSDSAYWWVEGGNGFATINGYRGRSWFYDNSTEGDIIYAGNVYAFRLQKISGSDTPNDPYVEILLEEL